MNNRVNFQFWLYTLLPFSIFALFVIFPFLLGSYYSLWEWDGISTEKLFVGLKNYSGLPKDPLAINALSFTVRFTLVSSVIINIVALIYALLLQKATQFNATLRVVLLLPNVIGGIILGFIWRFIFVQGVPSLGAITNFPLFNLAWLGDPKTAFWGTVTVFAWQQAGYIMIIYIASLTSISPQIYEAAEIDGASPLARLKNITLPLLRPAFTICIFVILANSFKQFALIFALTEGGPYNSTESLALNIYNEAFLYRNYGVASSKAVIFFLFVALISYLQVSITRKKEIQL